MAVETITTIKCDICGDERRSDQPIPHWTNQIAKVTLSMKDHPSLQRIPFEGDLCPKCGRSICDAIEAHVRAMRAEAGGAA